MSHSVLLELGNTCVVPQSADIDPFEDIQVGASHGSPLPAHHQTAAARRLLPATTAAPATALTTHWPSPALQPATTAPSILPALSLGIVGLPGSPSQCSVTSPVRASLCSPVH